MAIPESEYYRLKHACGNEMPYVNSMADKLDIWSATGAVKRSGTAAGTIPADRLILGHTDGTLLVGTLGSKRIVGVNATGASVATAGTLVIETGLVTVVAAEPILAGDKLKCGDNGRVLQLSDADELNKVIGTTAAGGDFGNQPANDAIEVLSSEVADVGQVVTIIGTTHGGVVTVTENVTLNGTTPVESVKQNWGIILAVKLSAVCAGTVTVREESTEAAVTTLATTVLSAGVVVVAAAAQGAHGLIPYIKAGAASTKSVGVLYEPATGAADALMTAALNGTTAVPMPAAANLVKEIYVGDVAAASTATAYVNATEDDEHLRVGKAVVNIAAGASGMALLTT